MNKLPLVRKFWILLVSGIVLLTSYLTVAAQSASPSPWIAEQQLSLQKESDLAPSVALPPAYNGNRDCTNHEFITRPGGLIVSQAKHTACGIQSNYGMMDPNGWLELNGTAVSGKLINHTGYRDGAIPIPASTSLINYTFAPAGLYLHFTKNLPLAITDAGSSTGEVTYRVSRPADASLRDKAGSLLQTQTDSLSFSADGRWLVVDSPGRAMLRVNTETLIAMPFAPAFNYGVGLAPNLQTAISADGRYAVVSSKNFGTFKIYDLSTCAAIPNSITAPVSCQSRDLLPLLQQQVAGFQGILHIRFTSADTLAFYVSYHATPGVASTLKTAKYYLSTSGGVASSIELLALGDSYISGEGAFEYKAGTDTEINRCHVSLVSYPYLVPKQLNLNSYNSVACSGAIMPDILNSNDDYKGQSEDKVERSNRPESFIETVFEEFLPGHINQLDFIKKHKPQRVLLSIGGNDIGFSKMLLRCVEPDTCYSTYEDRVELVREINRRLPKLVDTYAQIKNAGPPGMKVYAVGYPQIVMPGGSCGLNVRLNAQELEFASQITSYLDDVIELAAQKAGIGYADTENALTGHRLCETESFNTAVHGLTAGGDRPRFTSGPVGNESYHPNQLGHQLLAQSLLAGTQNLGAEMPASSGNAAPPLEDGLEILNAPKSSRLINKTNYDGNLTNDIIYREVWWDTVIEGIKYALKPSAPMNIFLNSEPVDLGTFSTDTSGNLSAQIRIPAAVPTGFHTLHVYGTNRANEPVDIYKTIYVAANENDYDGDGVANSSDSCTTMPESGVDKDQDGTDDACDGAIGPAPAVAAVSSDSRPSSTSTQTPSPAPIVRGPTSHMTTDEVQAAGSADDLSLSSGPAVVLAENPKTQEGPASEVSNRSYIQLNALSPSAVLAVMTLSLGSGAFVLRRLLLV